MMASFSGGTLDEALSRACEGLGVRIGEIAYEIVVDQPEQVVVEARVDSGAVLGLFLAEMFRAGELALSVRLRTSDEALEGELEGADVHLLEAHDGEGLDALQYLCNRVLDNRRREHPPVRLDAGGFKEQRARVLHGRARDAAERAVEGRCAVTLPPMTPAARREVHLALVDDPRVETASDGDGFVKRVVVRLRRRG